MQVLSAEPEHAARWVASRIQGDLEDLLPSILTSGNPILRGFLERAVRRSPGPVALLIRLVLIQRLTEVARWEDRMDFGFRGREPGEPPGHVWEYVVRLEYRRVSGRREDWADWTTIYEAGHGG
jgi:hypothetical protein